MNVQAITVTRVGMFWLDVHATVMKREILMKSKEGLAGASRPATEQTDHSRHSHHNHLGGTMKASVKDNNHNRVFKDVGKVSPIKLCDCPGSQPRKIIADIRAHLPGCCFRKRSSRYTTKTLAIPNNILDGWSLGIVLGQENL